MGERDKPPHSEEGDEHALVGQLLDLAKRIRQRFAERCEAEGVSASRFAILQAIAEANDDGCSQRELADQLGLSESNVCSLVERMRSTGLLFRFRSKADRRKSVLMLSEQGKELSSSILRLHNREAATLISGLNAEQRAQLRGLMFQLRAYLEGSPQRGIAAANFTDGQHWEPTARGPERTSRRAS